MYTFRFWIICVGVIVSATMLAVLSPSVLPTSFDVSLTLEVNRIEEASDEFFTYEGFYAIQSSEMFTKVVSSWFNSPHFVVDVLELSQIDTSRDNVSDFRGFFESESMASNLIEVRWAVDSEDKGVSITESIQSTLDDRISNNSEYENFQIFTNEPVIRMNKPNRIIFGMGGFLAGIFSIVCAIILVEMYKLVRNARSN
jgi:capsular polysaccharide biosynthesis protein